MPWWRRSRGAPAVATTPTEPRVAITRGMGWMSDEQDGCIANTWQNESKRTLGSSHLGFRIPHGGLWRPSAPADVRSFNPDDFGILRADGKLRAEMLKWIAVQHSSALPQSGKFGLQAATNMAIGVWGTLAGPRNPADGTLDPTATWARRSSDPTYGVDPLPYVEVGADGTAKPKLVTAPFGPYDRTLADGTAGSRFHVWLEADLRALAAFFDEDCETDGASPTVAWRSAHKRRDHYPWVQVKLNVNQDSLEYSRGAEPPINFHPTYSASQVTLSGTISASTLSIPWTGTPPSTGTAGDTWTPWCTAGASVSGRGCILIYDDRDPANLWEAILITGNATAGGGTSGTFTAQGRGTYGPPARAWAQDSGHIRIVMAQWNSSTIDNWVGTPGVGGAEAPIAVKRINRGANPALDHFALVDATVAVPVRLLNMTSWMAHAWKARADAAAGAPSTWVVGDRQPSSNPSIAGAENAPLPSAYVWRGDETEAEVETLVWRSFAEHARRAEMMVARALPRHRQVMYYGVTSDDGWFQGWNGSAVFDLSRSYVSGLPATPLIPASSFMARTVRRDYSGVNYPWCWKSATEWWSVSDYLFAATALPHLVDPACAGYDVRFAHGVTHFSASTVADGSLTPWANWPRDYGAWHLLKNQWRSSAPLVFQTQALNSGKHANGEQLVRSCEQAWSYDDSTVRPVTLECNYSRYTATGLDLNAAFVPTGALGGGWPGSANDAQQNYLIGTTNAIPSSDTAEAAVSIGRRVRTTPSAVTQV